MVKKTSLDSSNQPAPAPVGPTFQIHKLYLKEASFMILGEPTDLAQGWKPELQVEIHSKHETLPQENTYEVILHVKCLVSSNQKKTFETEIDYAGIFSIGNIEAEPLKHTLGSYCPSLLYPYLREAIADLVLKGGFPQLNLAPINFDLLFEQQQKA